MIPTYLLSFVNSGQDEAIYCRLSTQDMTRLPTVVCQLRTGRGYLLSFVNSGQDDANGGLRNATVPTLAKLINQNNVRSICEIFYAVFLTIGDQIRISRMGKNGFCRA